MSEKYLGKEFDIHAGGMDLLFPHHESEIAQSKACNHTNPAKYWLHNNMITVNGQKMAKSLDNGILIKELFSGNHRLLDQAYSPMTLRFFLLQAHYRSTLDFSNEALKAAEKGFQRLMSGVKNLEGISPSLNSEININDWCEKLYAQLNDDLSTPQVIATLFEAVKWINELNSNRLKISKEDLETLEKTFKLFVFEILGFVSEKNNHDQILDGVMSLVFDIRNSAKQNKDWDTADKIRNQLKELGIEIMDGKDGSSFKID
jgi:cysteinyl-tRNA synthetase